MYKVGCKILLILFVMTFIFGCAGLKELRGKEKLEAKDWLHSGNLALKVGDDDSAQYFYELVIKKYPDTYYAKKAAEQLMWSKARQTRIGRTIEKGKDLAEPVF